MSRNYDNWERLVAAVLKKQQLWELFHAPSRSPSILSETSDYSPSSFLNSPIHDAVVDSSGPPSSSPFWQQLEDAVSKLPKVCPKLVFVTDFNQHFDAEHVLLASAELLGRGTFGTTYAVSMETGVKFVVKRLKSMSILDLEFKRQMEIVGNVRHENVVTLRAYYSSQDKRLMLHDYYSNGSVSALLHGQTGEGPGHVDWKTRVRIAVGAARGIAQIHTQNGGKLVHGNIKSSNSFFCSQHYGCVSDLGLANMIATTFMPTALCHAPEVKNTENASQASDVYSFGILILELLTRKSPLHVRGHVQPVDLVKLVTSVKSKERAAKVFDADLLQYPNIKGEMVKMLQIGIKCVERSIHRRPKMAEVVKMLEAVMVMNIGVNVPTKPELVFVEDSNPTFDFADMLKAAAEVLGKGIFGSSYKATLHNGERIVVKRFKDVRITVKEFQQHVAIVGRRRHKSVAKLKAYMFYRDEILLVYDFYQDSLSALLHEGKASTGKITLNWETRLRIAADAARGIAHIHQHDGGKLVHGNIKSSNILLNGQKYGHVSDAGLAKLVKPIKVSDVRTRYYFAPEVKYSWNASQASDVYSFGVVLLELVTGKTSVFRRQDGVVISLVKWAQSRFFDGVPSLLILWEAWWELSLNEEEKMAMSLVLDIARDCVDNIPDRRPTMLHVVERLERTSFGKPDSDLGSKDTRERPFMESSLEHLLDDLLPTLTL